MATAIPTPTRELPEALCQIFSERVTLPVQPLPSPIVRAHLTMRQLYTWRQMGYTWHYIWQHYQPKTEYTSFESFRSGMRHQLQRWGLNNRIVDPPARTGKAFEKSVNAAKGYYDDEVYLFFGINGHIDLVNWTYQPALEVSKGTFLAAAANPPHYALPAPQDVPGYYRQEDTGLIAFDAWLQQNPAIYQHFMPTQFAAWQAQSTALSRSTSTMPTHTLSTFSLQSTQQQRSGTNTSGTSAPSASRLNVTTRGSAALLQNDKDADDEDEEETGSQGENEDDHDHDGGGEGQGSSTASVPVPPLPFFMASSGVSTMPNMPVYVPLKIPRHRDGHEPDSESDGDRSDDSAVIKRVAAINEDRRRRGLSPL